MPSTTIETWRPVPGYENYKVSDQGRVLGAYGRILAANPDGHGYPQVDLYANGIRRPRRVHILVAEAYHGPRPAPGYEVCHNTPSKTDNRAENLRWDTHAANMADAVQHGTHNNAGKTRCPQNHEYSEANTYRTPDGRRRCRACRTASNARYRANGSAS